MKIEQLRQQLTELDRKYSPICTIHLYYDIYIISLVFDRAIEVGLKEDLESLSSSSSVIKTVYIINPSQQLDLSVKRSCPLVEVAKLLKEYIEGWDYTVHLGEHEFHQDCLT